MAKFYRTNYNQVSCRHCHTAALILMRNEVRRHGSAAILGRIVSIVTGVAMTVLLARSLEPISFGHFAVFRTAITFLGLVCSFGLGTVSLRMLGELGSDNEHRVDQIKAILAKVAVMAFLASVLVGVAVLLLTPWFAPWLFAQPGTLLLAGAIVVASLGIGWLQIITDAARGLHYPSLSALFGGVRGTPIASVCLFVVLYTVPTWIDGDWVKVASSYGVGLVLSASIALLLLKKAIARFATQNQNSLISEARESGAAASSPSLAAILAVSCPLAISGALMFLTTQGDFFLTGWFPSETDRYAYIAARRWALLVAMPLAALNLTAGGLIAGATDIAKKSSLQSFLRAGTTVIGIPSLFFSLAAIVAPELMLYLLFGPGYEAAATVLPILVIGQVFVVITGPCGLVLSLTGHERISLQLAVVGFAALFIVGPWMALNHGAIGLAWLVTISAAVISVVTWLQCRRLTGLNTFLEPSLVIRPTEFFSRLHLSRKSA